MSIKVLVFSGSYRPGSFNQKLANLAARELKALGAEVTEVSLKDYNLPLVDASGFGNAPQGAQDFRAAIDAHDALFIASPEYNAGYAPALKNALDWATVAKPGAPASGLAGKVAALGAASGGALGGYRGLTQLRTVLELGFGATLTPAMVTVAGADKAFAEDGSLVDTRTADFFRQTLQQLVTMTTKLKA